MLVVRGSDSPVFDLDGFTIFALAQPSRGAAELCAWRLRVLPGAESGVHSLDHEEVFVVVSGVLTVRVAGKEQEVRADDALVVPAGTDFSLTNAGDVPCMAVVTVRAGLVAMVGGQRVTPPWAT